MAEFKVFLVLALAALCAVASAEEEKVEKVEKVEEVEATTPEVKEVVEDDGSYWPGKYDKPVATLVPVPTAYSGLIPAVHHIPAVYPYPYATIPFAKAFYY